MATTTQGNLPIPFTRSIRSLNTSSLTASLVTLTMAVLLFIAWVSWFFFAQIAFYEVSQAAQITQVGMVVADFTPETVERIQFGQPAFVRLDNGAIKPRAQTLPAFVTNIDPKTGRVQLVLQRIDDIWQLQGGSTGQVEIEVEHVSPATLVLRASGLFSKS